MFRSSGKLSNQARLLIQEIIAAEESGTSSQQLIDTLTQVLHVAIRPAPTVSESDYPGIRRALEQHKRKS